MLVNTCSISTKTRDIMKPKQFNNVSVTKLDFYLLGKGGYVFGCVGLSVCLFVDITQKVMNGLG